MMEVLAPTFANICLPSDHIYKIQKTFKKLNLLSPPSTNNEWAYFPYLYLSKTLP